MRVEPHCSLTLLCCSLRSFVRSQFALHRCSTSLQNSSSMASEMRRRGAAAASASSSSVATTADAAAAAAAAAESTVAATLAPAPAPAPAPHKSLLVAYALWLLGGLWGAHHLYLGRDAQAIICKRRSTSATHSMQACAQTSCMLTSYALLLLCCCSALRCAFETGTASFGGLFGVGWLRDGWRLASYVRWANSGAAEVHRVVLEYSLSPRAPARSGLAGLCGQVLLSAWLGEILSTAFDLLQPEALPRFPTWASSGGSLQALLAALMALPHLLRMLSVILRVLGVALGATVAGNFSPLQHSSFLPVLGATAVAQGLAMAFISSSSPTSSKTASEPADVEEWSERCWSAIVVAVAVYTWRRTWSLQARQMVSRAQQQARAGVIVAEGSDVDDAAAAKSVRMMVRDSPAVRFTLAEARAPDASALAVAGRRGLCVRFLRYTLAGWLFVALSSSYVLNCSVAHTPLKVSLARSLASPDFQRVWMALGVQWADLRRKGHAEWWRALKADMDLGGLDGAYATLDFTPAEVAQGVSPSQLRKRRNQLALKFHPDKNSEGLSPLERDTKFAEIQKVRRQDAQRSAPASSLTRFARSHLFYPCGLSLLLALAGI